MCLPVHRSTGLGKKCEYSSSVSGRACSFHSEGLHASDCALGHNVADDAGVLFNFEQILAGATFIATAFLWEGQWPASTLCCSADNIEMNVSL